MSSLNHFAISSILGSEIVGPFKAGHGQIGSLQDAQRYFDKLEASRPLSVLHEHEHVDTKIVKSVFLALREARGDRGSPELYVADSERNAAFLAKCQEAGLEASPYKLNKVLLGARKSGLLPDLHSVRTKSNHEEFAFAVEFAATELKYRRGTSIDDMLCDPDLASEFDSIAKKISPGHTPFEYRWAILSIRKAGLKSNKPADFRVPELNEQVPLMSGSLNTIPDTCGVYLLYERSRPLYARGTEHLRHGIELLQEPEAISVIADMFWEPEVGWLSVKYATVSVKQYVRPAELAIIGEKKPLFNVPRNAA